MTLVIQQAPIFSMSVEMGVLCATFTFFVVFWLGNYWAISEKTIAKFSLVDTLVIITASSTWTFKWSNFMAFLVQQAPVCVVD